MKQLQLFKIIALIISVTLLSVASPAVQAKNIKIATLSPDGTFWMKQMRVGAKEIKKKTEGRVKFKFYPGGVMGNDENVLRKIRIGQLHGGAVTINTLSYTTPDITMYGLPFIFSSLEQAKEVRKITDLVLSKEIEKNGFVNFGFAQGGFSYMMSKHKIKTIDDLKQQKSWIPEKSDIGLSVYNNIGVTPISLPMSDVLTGLQTGLINNVITSPIGALALQWHTHVNYVVDLPLNYLAAMMIIDKKTFYKLSKADQQVVRQVMGKVYRKIDEQNMIDNISARKAMINQGIEFVTLSDAEKVEWIRLGDKVITEMAAKYKYSKPLFDAVTANKLKLSKLH